MERDEQYADLRRYMDEIHEYVTVDARERDKLAEQRHKELIRTIEDGAKLVAKAINAGIAALADALRRDR